MYAVHLHRGGQRHLRIPARRRRVVITLRLVLIICSLFVLLLRREVQRGSAAKTELETAERLIAQQARQYEQSAKNIELININIHLQFSFNNNKN